ncbi:protection of telomeres protein 1 isoform X2 [Cottoperca gobio]|uniref:Protection of telomeres protein 1 n=1 Tax=Cottoperca gobio TaxID=56716 RepID=A0A6J2PCR4_COTGO|nr:protection of telomeres protein 1 isoform X2 [Cottoperca gobio]
MPVHVLSEGAGPGAQVPTHLTRIPISLISTSTDYSNRTVQGKVVRKCPLVSLASDNLILKIIIQEEDSPPDASSPNPSINVILLGALAKDSNQAVNQGVSRPPPPPPPRSPPAAKRSSPLCAEVSRATKAPKYTYVRLDELTAGSVVNVYGVVVFFKQPFKTRGTDFCSSLKITDQSNEKIGCTVFCEKLEDHPKIYQIGDIVRLHRVKTQFFNNSMTLVKTFGFSVVAFDGVEGGSMEPRTSSRSFHFSQEDRRTVEELRSWAANQALLPAAPTIALSAVQPKAYFDLTCQLLAKAAVDTTCTLLRVWDGTRSPHTLLKVMVEPNVTEGPSSFSQEREGLIANVLVYDNHVEYARQLKPGDFLRIYNLRAIPGSSKVPGLTSSQQEEVDHLAFHLHGGTAFGRGIRILPENCPDVQQLKRVLEACPEDDEDDFSELNDSALLEIWSTPPESLDAEAVECSAERSCDHSTQPLTLSEVKRSDPGRVHHVRVQLRSYEPRRLHQALKLYCSKCTSMQDVPDDELVAGLFSEASQDSAPCSPPPWALSGRVDVPGNSPGSPTRTLSVHLSTELVSKQLMFLTGSTLEETCRLAAGYQNIVPVRSAGGRLALLDPPAPFLFRGRKRYYGCERCSEAAVREPSRPEGVEQIDEKILAEALGVQLLQHVLLMKLELQDATDSLDVFLWRDAESFFGVSAEDVAANQEAQNSIHQKMDSLCPAGGSTGERPWMDLCLTAYGAEDDGGQNQTCYQICNSTITSTPSNANPS